MDFIKENWELIKDTLRTEYDLSDISYNTWVKPLNFHSVKDDIVTIMIPSDQAHALKYISSKYKSYFQVTISEMMDHTYDIAFILEKDTEDEMNNSIYKLELADGLYYLNFDINGYYITYESVYSNTGRKFSYAYSIVSE